MSAAVRLLIAGENPEGGVFPAGLLSVGILLPVDGVDFLKIQLAGRSSKKNTRWFSGNQSTGDGSSSSVCSGFQGRKNLGLTMPHSLAQIHSCHWNLGRFQGVCGEGWL